MSQPRSKRQKDKVTKPQLEGCGATPPCPVARNDGMTTIGRAEPLPPMNGSGAPLYRYGIGNAGVDNQDKVTKPQPEGWVAKPPLKPGGEYLSTDRLHAFVFSDDEDDSQEHADWMSGVEVVRNRPSSFKVWLERFGSDSRALRDRKNLRKVNSMSSEQR